MVEIGMLDLELMAIAFEKAAATKGRFTIAQTRKGRRPMSVEKMLEKDKAGTLFKGASAFRRGVMWEAFDDELLKMGESPEGVDDTEARAALKRLHTLEATKPTGQQLARGAVAGGAVGTLAGLANRVVSPGGIKELGKGFRGAGGARNMPMRFAKGMLHAGRTIAAPAASSAVIGTALPVVRSHLDRQAEKQKLRDYLQMSSTGTANRMRNKITRAIGV